MGRVTVRNIFAVAVAVAAVAGCSDGKIRSIFDSPNKPDNEGAAEQHWNPEDPHSAANTRPPEVTEPTGCPAYCDAASPQTLTRVKSENPILAENLLPGDWDWRDGISAHHREVELYASTEAASVGETISVKVSANAASRVTASVYRIGHYGGAGARKVWTGGPYAVSEQAACATDAKTGRVSCEWKDTFTFQVEPSWTSGLYAIKVLREDGFKRFYPFVVRDLRAAEILFTPNFTTYQAYNTWGGESLYFDGAGIMPSGRAWQVSFNRPYEATDGGGKTFNLDLYFIQFLEKHGYDVTYGSQLDFIRYSNVLEGIGAMVHAGQDEYWPVQERAQIDAALGAGKMSLAYFGGNGGYWKVRLVSDEQGNPLRTLLCYKNEPQHDPKPNTTLRFRDEPDAMPEQNLFGVMYEGWQVIPFPLVVGDTSHWIFKGTGLSPGTQLRGLVGFEYDRAFPDWEGYPAGFKVVMKSPVVSGEGIPSYTQAVERTLQSGRLVFSAGTIWWPLALSGDPEFRDDRVARMTLNVLEKALAHRRPPRSFPPVTKGFPAQVAPNPVWAKDVAPFVGIAGEPGYQDGPATVARFSSPTGLAVTQTGELVIADTGNNRIRLVGVDPQRTVTTIAGDGVLGYRDGEGSQAMFRMPTGVAVGPQNEIYVTDSDNHVIRRLDKTATGWTVSTVAGGGFQMGYTDGVGTAARFNRPVSLDADAAGNLVVADEANNRIRYIAAGTNTVTTLAGSGGYGGDDAAVGTQATFNNPTGVSFDASGNVYVMDAGSQLIRRIAAMGAHAVTTVAGNKNAWFGFADGAGDVARFSAQLGMDVSLTGELMIADTANYRIRKVVVGATPSATQVFTIAGSGLFGIRTGPADQSDIVSPTGLAFGTNEKLYVSDSFHHVIREITR